MKYNESICKCSFCGKQFKNARGVNSHECYCSLNPNKRTVFPKPSAETKKKISESRKKYLAKHPDKVPFKLNHSSKQSYPEKYFENWLIKEQIFDQKEFQVERYSLDFAWPDKLIYLEIDGSQHSLDWMIEHDAARTKYLTEQGWTCIGRVYWPRYKSYSKEEKVQYLSNLKNAIVNSSFVREFKSDKEIQEEVRSHKLEIGELVLDKLGRAMPLDKKFPDKVWEERKQLILNSNVDLTKFGWKTKVEKATGLTRRQVCDTIERFQDIFNNIVYIRSRQ